MHRMANLEIYNVFKMVFPLLYSVILSNQVLFIHIEMRIAAAIHISMWMKMRINTLQMGSRRAYVVLTSRETSVYTFLRDWCNE